jgi:dolichol-phosphate mannosyltransferase
MSKENLFVFVVFTTRRTRAGESPVTLAVIKLGYRILRAVSDIELVPNSRDFKLSSKRVVKELLRVNEQRPILRGLIRWVGFRQVQVFYDRDARHAGRTHFPVLRWKVISNFFDSALISFLDVPLKIAFVLGFLVSLVAIFGMKPLGWNLPGWSAIMATMLVLGGLQLLTIGALGLYINAIFRETRWRPNYIVKDTFGFDER